MLNDHFTGVIVPNSRAGPVGFQSLGPGLVRGCEGLYCWVAKVGKLVSQGLAVGDLHTWVQCVQQLKRAFGTENTDVTSSTEMTCSNSRDLFCCFASATQACTCTCLDQQRCMQLRIEVGSFPAFV